MNELALFAGGGGGILGGKLLGWTTVGAVEIEPYCIGIHLQRQNDGLLPPYPVWDDIRSFTGRNNACRRYFRYLRSIRNTLVVSGGFPCQDISCAGTGAGIDGERSGLWRYMARTIGEIRPRHVLVENSPRLTVRGLDRVLGDLTRLGYDARWGVVSAADAIWSGSLASGDNPALDHLRERIWIWGECQWTCAKTATGCEQHTTASEQSATCVKSAGSTITTRDSKSSHAQSQRTRRLPERAEETNAGFSVICENADADGAGREQQRRAVADGAEYEAAECRSWWLAEPDVGRVAHGVAARVDRLKALGNGQVPDVVALAHTYLATPQL